MASFFLHFHFSILVYSVIPRALEQCFHSLANHGKLRRMNQTLLPKNMPNLRMDLWKRCFISLINFRNSFRGIYDCILLKHPFRAITLTLAFCQRTDQSDCNSVTRTKLAHTHTNMSRPWYVRHASTTPENDLHPFSGLSFPQWCSPSGLQNL